LQSIAVHPFFEENAIIDSLPISVLHRAPVWNDDVGAQATDVDASSQHSGKASIPRSNSCRQPFASRHPNMQKSHGPSSQTKPEKSEKPERDTIDLQKVVKSAMSIATGVVSRKPVPVPPVAFHIFDESKTTETPSDVAPTRIGKSPQTRVTVLSEEMIVTRTKALSLGTSTPTQAAIPSESPSSGNINSEKDTDVLRKMVDQLDTVLTIADTRKGSYRTYSPHPISTMHEPSRWVTRYVDYTSKYGLGFLLNDGSSGVYFNDSTKTALEANGEVFQYIERKRDDKDAALGRRPDAVVETYTLSSYPESLKKKVTLLTHFRNYLIEQQKKASEEEAIPAFTIKGDASELTYVKKWIQTKHAILFRLSNHTIQVVFYDQTEVLLTPDTRYVTYVDKNRQRATYMLDDELVGTSSELEKRLKYTKEIVSQLLSGQRR